MKKIPLILFPLAVFLITTILFVTIVPPGDDLISAEGDYALGVLTSYALIFCGIMDIALFLRKRSLKK